MTKIVNLKDYEYIKLNGVYIKLKDRKLSESEINTCERCRFAKKTIREVLCGAPEEELLIGETGNYLASGIFCDLFTLYDFITIKNNVELLKAKLSKILILNGAENALCKYK